MQFLGSELIEKRLRRSDVAGNLKRRLRGSSPIAAAAFRNVLSDLDVTV
jgi:hypothetical protein